MAASMFFILTFPIKVYQQIQAELGPVLVGLVDVSINTNINTAKVRACCQHKGIAAGVQN